MEYAQLRSKDDGGEVAVVRVLWKAVAGVVLFVGLVGMCVGPASARTVLTVYRNQSKVIKIKNLRRVTITNNRIVDFVIVSPEELILNGISYGRTTMYLWDDKGRKEIELLCLEDRQQLPRLIKEAIDLPGVEVKLIERPDGQGVIMLKGKVESDYQAEVAQEIARAYSNLNVLNLLEAEGTNVPVKDRLEKMLDLPEVKVTVVYPQTSSPGRATAAVQPSAIILEGFVDDQRDTERAEQLARTFCNQVINLIEVVNPIQVQIDAHFLEMTRNYNTAFGVSYGTVEATYSGDQISVDKGTFTQNSADFIENLFYSYRGDVRTLGPRIDPKYNYPWEFENLNRLDPLMAQVDFNVQRGTARVLASPKVVTRSGTEAMIRVGGEIPTQGESQGGGTSIEYRNYGLEMRITPEVDHKGNITAKIDITWSTLDPGNGITVDNNLIPALRERSTHSEVTVRDGQHIIISGLINKEEGRRVSGIPFLKDIPVLGRLFQSRTFTSGESELVMIVTPELLASKKMREKFHRYDEDEEAPLSMEEITKQMSLKDFKRAVELVDRTFAKILDRDTPTIVPVPIYPACGKDTAVASGAYYAKEEDPEEEMSISKRARALLKGGSSDAGRTSGAAVDLDARYEALKRRLLGDKALSSPLDTSKVVEELEEDGGGASDLSKKIDVDTTMESIVTEMDVEDVSSIRPGEKEASAAGSSEAIEDRIDDLFSRIKRKLKEKDSI